MDKRLKQQVLNQQYWFVPIPRTGSTTLRNVLGIDEWRWPQFHRSGGHQTALFYRDFFTEEVWAEIFTFTIVRNPWDRMLSWYLSDLGKTISEDITFEKFLADPTRYVPHLITCSEYILDDDGNILVDFIGKYENLESDWKKILMKIADGWGDKIGANIEHNEFAKLPVLNVAAGKKDYHDCYNADMRERVAELCKRDIELFDYEF